MTAGCPCCPRAGGGGRGKGSVTGAATSPRDPQPTPSSPAVLKARPCVWCRRAGGFTSVAGREIGHKCSQYSQISRPFPTVFCRLFTFLLTNYTGAGFIFFSDLGKSNCSESSGVAQSLSESWGAGPAPPFLSKIFS